MNLRDGDLDGPPDLFDASYPPSDFVFTPGAFQRLVGNPFLAFTALIATLWIMNFDDGGKLPAIQWFAYACLILAPFLFQFHCLDCGRTAHLRKWRKHACPSVRARCQLGGNRRWTRDLSPTVQSFLWFYGFLVFAFFWFVLHPGSMR